MGAVSGVTLENVTVSYGANRALDDVSLSVEQGEFFTLVGPSGCGKTTLLRTIAGFETPEAGTVAIGEDVAGVPPDDRDVGVVFQDYALFPHMTVRENVAYGLRYRDPPAGVDADERVEDLLALVEVAGLADRDPEALSGGQRQRVALARALAPGPDVLLLDEPLSALDARLRERLRVEIREIQRELSTTTIYVTHDQAEALAISDRVAVIQDGRVEQVATPETLYRDPATRFVAEFVGDNNLFDGEVVSADPPRAAVGDGTAHLPLPGTPTVGESVTLSVRPEAIALGDDAAPVTLPATVETTEFTGDAYRVHCDWQDRTLLVKSTATAAPSGRVTLGIHPAVVTILEDR
ncbi:ABC transporter ATP-binding protein [Halobacteriales archaeon Cl-PHB]